MLFEHKDGFNLGLAFKNHNRAVEMRGCCTWDTWRETWCGGALFLHLGDGSTKIHYVTHLCSLHFLAYVLYLFYKVFKNGM